jgi:hypothetical protein
MAIRDIVRDIGRALGLGGGNASGAGGTTRSIGRDIAAARSSMISRPGDRDGPDRSERQAAAAAPAQPAPAPVVQPVTPPAATTPMPPAAPAPVDLAAPTTSEAEAAAVDSTTRGRASTILTGMQGLLADEEPTGQLRRRRSLMGGGLIK